VNGWRVRELGANGRRRDGCVGGRCRNAYRGAARPLLRELARALWEQRQSLGPQRAADKVFEPSETLVGVHRPRMLRSNMPSHPGEGAAPLQSVKSLLNGRPSIDARLI